MQILWAFFSSLLLVYPLTYSHAAGQHAGEADKIQAQVNFHDQAGYTTTDASGIYYHFGSNLLSEPKIYPSWTYGIEYPLYFVGSTMRFSVTLTNTSTQGNKSFKIRIQALNHAMETDGALGMELAPPQEWIVESLKPGETKTLEGSVYIAPNPDLPSGLDVTKIRIS
ncbi:MAG: hypothetical protein HY400_07790, partial [Elusimicrobia bacterium]|nr:hypothetical protein [Elusimicrobiota bacterium]